ncbi:MAG: hypothetical protein ACRDL8_06485, partial [Solirubrobacteraceae bacterium]
MHGCCADSGPVGAAESEDASEDDDHAASLLAPEESLQAATRTAGRSAGQHTPSVDDSRAFHFGPYPFRVRWRSGRGSAPAPLPAYFLVSQKILSISAICERRLSATDVS